MAGSAGKCRYEVRRRTGSGTPLNPVYSYHRCNKPVDEEGFTCARHTAVMEAYEQRRTERLRRQGRLRVAQPRTPGAPTRITVPPMARADPHREIEERLARYEREHPERMREARTAGEIGSFRRGVRRGAARSRPAWCGRPR